MKKKLSQTCVNIIVFPEIARLLGDAVFSKKYHQVDLVLHSMIAKSVTIHYPTPNRTIAFLIYHLYVLDMIDIIL